MPLPPYLRRSEQSEVLKFSNNKAEEKRFGFALMADLKSAFSQVYSQLKSNLFEDPAFEFADDSRQWLDRLPDKEEEEEELQCTPMAASKSPICSALDCIVSVIDNHKDRVIADDKSTASSSNTKTPPIQASFSPEIQSSTTMTTSSACYAAGHLISGVTDKRKCRARGILAVALPADNDMSTSNSDNVDPKQGYATGLVSKSSVSRLPSPAKASVHWLDLSPCREADEDDKEFSVPLNSLLQANKVPSPPSSHLSDVGSFLDLCNLSNDASVVTNSCTTRKSRIQRNTQNRFVSTDQCNQFQVRLDSLCDHALVSLSPNATPCSPPLPLKEEAKHSYTIDGGNSPFSTDTLGSENVMQTPNSESSLERLVELSCSSAKDCNRHQFHSEILSLAADLQGASLSPKSHVSVWDATDSSFQFDRLSTPSSSVDLSPFQKISYDQFLWTSDSTFENVSQSQMSVSWRDGLVSQIFEKDEFDRCRCLSDEEEDFNVNSSDPSKSSQSLEINVDVGNVPNVANACECSEFLDGKSNDKRHSPVQCSYTESICTDGPGGLTHSADSDWNLFYKNNQFKV
ncbi:hypothetical protein COLO4_23477 [Corchorus olitorius]|uniref:Uncharacterized protein n=1 Tax=Corchorus olitorius TaxID=93759 RepID=A0A1R3IGA9_9ROSI|nr:hypothetical protein COLO4_23477 [Corchorus olitorius]